jgi:hypothetical protein
MEIIPLKRKLKKELGNKVHYANKKIFKANQYQRRPS